MWKTFHTESWVVISPVCKRWSSPLKIHRWRYENIDGENLRWMDFRSINFLAFLTSSDRCVVLCNYTQSNDFMRLQKASLHVTLTHSVIERKFSSIPGNFLRTVKIDFFRFSHRCTFHWAPSFLPQTIVQGEICSLLRKLLLQILWGFTSIHSYSHEALSDRKKFTL